MQVRSDQPGAVAPPRISLARARYGVGLLTLIYLLGFVDRLIMSILAEPIRLELHLADWQIGAVTGLAFALLYTMLGIPIARMAERRDRSRIISAAVLVWSAFTMLCGHAHSFVQLALARVGVGVGEAGCTPAAMSLISDYVGKERRASATGFYLSGAPIGALIGMAMGGVVTDLWGWRAAFLLAGAPGVVVAILAFLTLPEPRRARPAEQVVPVTVSPVPLKQTLALLVTRRSYLLIVAGTTLTAMLQYSIHAFLGSFFFRNFAPELAVAGARFGLHAAGFLGIALGLVLGITGVIGSSLGGIIADRLGRKSLRRALVFAGLATMAEAPFFIIALSHGSLWGSLGLLLIPGVLMLVHAGPAYGLVQGLVAPEQRATATALMLFVINLLGLGAGPLVVGLISDTIRLIGAVDGATSIRWALYCVVSISVPAGLLFIAAGRHIEREQMS